MANEAPDYAMATGGYENGGYQHHEGPASTIPPPEFVITKAAPSGEQVESGGAARGQWGRKAEFLLTCIGYAVGLGNVWRFPYLAFKNGGGAFLIPYVLMLALVGLPVFFFELSLGQFAGRGPVSAWVICPIAKGIGMSTVAISSMVALYYNVIITWSFAFLFRSFGTTVPWIECNKDAWADDRCFTGKEIKAMVENATLKNETLGYYNLTWDELQTPSEQYFYREILKMSDSIDDAGAPVYDLVLTCMLVWIVVFLALFKGISSLGKVMYFVTTFPYIMMTVLIVRGGMLNGAYKGIMYYITPDFNRLLDAQVWSDAATQIFFSLSACMGGLVAMGSFNQFRNNCFRDSLIVPFVNCATSVYAGFAIFSVLGYMAEEKGLDDVGQVAEAGPGLVFVVYPEALSTMPIPSLWSILFFIMLILLGFSSSFSIVETIFVSIMDEFPEVLRKTPMRPVIFRGVGCATMFLLSIPMLCNNGFHLFTIVEDFSGSIPLLIVGLTELAAVTWIYGIKRYSKDVSLMLGHPPNIFFRVTWTALSPAILGAILVASSIQYSDVQMGDGPFPSWAISMGWAVTAFCIVWIPVVVLYRMFSIDLLRASTKSSPLWQPSDPAYREPHTKAHRSPTVFTVGDEKIDLQGSPVPPKENLFCSAL